MVSLLKKNNIIITFRSIYFKGRNLLPPDVTSTILPSCFSKKFPILLWILFKFAGGGLSLKKVSQLDMANQFWWLNLKEIITSLAKIQILMSPMLCYTFLFIFSYKD